MVVVTQRDWQAMERVRRGNDEAPDSIVTVDIQ